MAALTFTTLELAPESEATKLSEPFTILHVGTFKRPDFPKDGIKVSAADLDQAVKNFNEVFAPSGGIPVDQDHAFAEGREAPALGWIRQMWRDGDDLKVRAEWNADGARAIASKQYPLISPEFSTAWKDEQGDARGFTVLAAGLTSRPFLKSLPPVSLSDKAREFVAEQAAALTSLSGPFTYTNGSGANYTVTLTTTNSTGVAGVPKDAPDMTEPTVTAKDVEALTEKLSEATDHITALTERVSAAEERATTAEAKHEETAKALFAEQLQRTLDRAKREGRIDAKDETTTKWTERAEKHGIAFVAELLNDIPAETIPMTERGHGKDRPLADTDAPEGVDGDRHAIDVRANALIAEGKTDDYLTAAHMAADELGVTL